MTNAETVWVVEREPYADNGVASGPVFTTEADARAFVDKHSPQWTNRITGKVSPNWMVYSMDIYSSVAAAEASSLDSPRC